MNEIAIRPYEARDREAIRSICCDTADRGEPVERFFPDREIFADLLTTYYPDCEPEAAWVAECEGKVVGYLTGALNPRRYRRLFYGQVIPKVFGKAVWRGGFWNIKLWSLGVTLAMSGLRHRVESPVSLRDYPAHLHLNIAQGFRGGEGGKQLIEKCCEQVKGTGLQGVSASVRRDNEVGRHFFEKMGFQLLTSDTGYTVIYGKRV